VKNVWFASLALCACLACVGCTTAQQTDGSKPSVSAPTVVAPALVGLDRGQSEAALKVAGLALGDVTDAFAATATAGIVVSQTPTAGADMAGGSTVAIVVSKGPEFVSVPSVIGKSKTDAIALLEAAGFKVKAANKDNKAKKSTVFAQSPAAGKLAQPGSTVTVSVSTGVVMVTVPNLYGKWYDTSEAILRKLGLRYHERVNEDELGPYGGVGPGEIYRQSPKAGASVPRGTIVTISFNIYE